MKRPSAGFGHKSGTEMDRRELLSSLGPALVVAGLGLFARDANAVDGPVAPALVAALTEIHEASAAVGAGTMSPPAWQDAVQQAAGRIDRADLLAAIDFERLRARMGYAERGVVAERARLPDLFGDGRRLAFYPKVFAVGRGRAVIPHGHRSMVSGHLVLSGRFHLRQYDRVGDADGHMLIRPTVDRREGPGRLSTISDERNNVHWLVAEEDSHTLDFIITGVGARAGAYEIQNIDVASAVDVGGGVAKARYMEVDAALAKYGEVQ